VIANAASVPTLNPWILIAMFLLLTPSAIAV
jgi:hypothetical protein